MRVLFDVNTDGTLSPVLVPADSRFLIHRGKINSIPEALSLVLGFELYETVDEKGGIEALVEAVKDAEEEEQEESAGC